jgi:hypothetical protein
MLKNVLIGTDVAYTTVANPSLLTAGQIGVYAIEPDGTNNGFTRLTDAATGASAAAAGKSIIVAQGTSQGVVRSFVITPGKKVGYTAQAFTAAVPNVFTAGFDGVTTTYDLVSGAAGTYGFKVQNLTMGNPPFPTYSSTPYFETAAAATSSAIGQAIVKDINRQTLLVNNDVMPEKVFSYLELLSNANSVQLVTSVPANITGTFINGSPSVTLSGSTAGGTTVLNAGDFLRVGHATTKTLAVYKVISVSGTAVVLDTPYVNPGLALGASVATVALGYITAANAAAAVTGIRVTEMGNVFPGSQFQEQQPNKILNISCSVNLSGTPVQNNSSVSRAYLAAAGTITAGIYNEGTGLSFQVKKKEFETAGYNGFINRTWLPDNYPFYTVEGTNYDSIGLQIMGNVTDMTAQGFVLGEVYDTLIFVPVNAGSNQYETLQLILGATGYK